MTMKFLPLARAVAAMSKDPSTKVGAVVLDDDKNVLSVGYNGFPRGMNDSPIRYEHRPTKLAFIAHAEANAIAQAARNGVCLKNSTIILTALYPCSNCAKLIVQAGIKNVLAPRMRAGEVNDLWVQEKVTSETIFKECGVKVELYD